VLGVYLSVHLTQSWPQATWMLSPVVLACLKSNSGRSAQDQHAKVPGGGGAVVTADKGNGPLRVRSNADVAGGGGRRRGAAGQCSALPTSIPMKTSMSSISIFARQAPA